MKIRHNSEMYYKVVELLETRSSKTENESMEILPSELSQIPILSIFTDPTGK